MSFNSFNPRSGGRAKDLIHRIAPGAVARGVNTAPAISANRSDRLNMSFKPAQRRRDVFNPRSGGHSRKRTKTPRFLSFFFQFAVRFKGNCGVYSMMSMKTMQYFPETRVSLILRLAKPTDVQAWQEFLDVYVPALYSMARRRGLQPADAEDVAQETLFAVARAAEGSGDGR